MHRAKALILAGCLLAQAAATPTQAAAAGPRSLPVGRCINTGNMLETSPQESGWGGIRLAAKDFQRIRAAGFGTVRIPVNWLAHSADTPPYAIDPAWMKRVSGMVDAALASGLNVVLNSHYFTPVHDTPAAGAPRLAAAWSQIAKTFATRSERSLWFEIENEPHNQLTNANLMATLSPALAAIRASNPTRPVVIGGGNWSGVDSLATLELPADPNLYPTFHYYEPFDFTHQGASWVEAKFPLGRVYGSEADKARLAADVAKVLAFIDRTGMIPFMGETGAYDMAPLEQRIAYHRAIREAFDPLGVGICAWAYANTFPFWDDKAKRWLPGLNEAFGLPGRAGTRKK